MCHHFMTGMVCDCWLCNLTRIAYLVPIVASTQLSRNLDCRSMDTLTRLQMQEEKRGFIANLSMQTMVCTYNLLLSSFSPGEQFVYVQHGKHYWAISLIVSEIQSKHCHWHAEMYVCVRTANPMVESFTLFGYVEFEKLAVSLRPFFSLPPFQLNSIPILQAPF